MGDGDFAPLYRERPEKGKTGLPQPRGISPRTRSTPADPISGMREDTVDTSLHTPPWNWIRKRWIVYAQTAKTQWPEIRFDDLLATDGSRSSLTRLVADTYGLDMSSAEHAVHVWHHGLSEWDGAPPGYTAA